MIKIKDKKTGDLWKIYETGESAQCKNDSYSIYLADHKSIHFNTLTEALQWVSNRMIENRILLKGDKPRTFWDILIHGM